MDRIGHDIQKIFQILQDDMFLLFIVISANIVALILLCLLLYRVRLWFGKTNQWLSVLAKIEERMWALEIQIHSGKEQLGDTAGLQESQKNCSDYEKGTQMPKDLPAAKGKADIEAELELLIRE